MQLLLMLTAVCFTVFELLRSVSFLFLGEADVHQLRLCLKSLLAPWYYYLLVSLSSFI